MRNASKFPRRLHLTVAVGLAMVALAAAEPHRVAAAALLHDPLSAPTPPGNLEEIILVYKSHFDIGYTHLASEVIQRYRTRTIEQALARGGREPGPARSTSSSSGPSPAGR